MLSKSKILPSFRYRFFSSKSVFIDNSYFDLSEEVRNGLDNKKPVVALESTIVTHGMPYPSNVECALEVEKLVREQGAIPATISIIDGKIKVGTTSEQLNFLGDTQSSNPVKTSRRDLAFVLSNKRNGGTTVAGTLVVANKVQIPIFATGGIGGVHRGAEHNFDISADLNELGRSNVAVVSSGVKSILDIPKTLEYLETQGVLVATFGETNDFPAFYSRMSGCISPYFVNSVKKAAEIIKASRDVNLCSGLLFAVPVPEEHAIESNVINDVIDKSLRNMPKDIQGKSITPYLLAEVAKLTSGKSLLSNIALIKNNAMVAAKIAVALSQLGSVSEHTRKDSGVGNRPVIIGGTNLDCSAKLDTAEIQVIIVLLSEKQEATFKNGYDTTRLSAIFTQQISFVDDEIELRIVRAAEIDHFNLLIQ